MTSPSAVIVFINKKHSNHDQIEQALEANYSVEEISLLSQSEQQCGEKVRIDKLLSNLKLLIVYLSIETKNHSCICYFIQKAVQNNIKVIGIWLDNSVLNDMTTCMIDFGDVVTNYPCDLDKIIQSNLTPWLGPDGNKIDKIMIKKHTCG